MKLQLYLTRYILRETSVKHTEDATKTSQYYKYRF